MCREHTLVPPVGPLRPPNVESRVVRYMYTKSISPDLIHLPEGPSTLASLYHGSIVARLRIPSLLYQGSNPVSIQRTSRTYASVLPALETVALHFRDEMSASLRE